LTVGKDMLLFPHYPSLYQVYKDFFHMQLHNVGLNLYIIPSWKFPPNVHPIQRINQFTHTIFL